MVSQLLDIKLFLTYADDNEVKKRIAMINKRRKKNIKVTVINRPKNNLPYKKKYIYI